MKKSTFIRTKTTWKIVFVFLMTLLGHAWAQQVFHDPAGYLDRGLGAAGWVNVMTPTGGLYVYGPEPAVDPKVSPFAVGRAQRNDYEFFSAEEEEALWRLRQEQATAQENAAQRERSRIRRAKVKAQNGYKWPRVVVRGNEVCVPAIENSEDRDWQEHLICTEGKWDE